ncbi:rubrerythrin-like domain-containing protein [Halorussus marinus]|nr:rubrerythrin-like domain-containing protein [Halorussus marinus]
MVRTDTYSPDGGTYECRRCLHRAEAPDHPGSCPECDGPLRNIAVPRE